ncbi:CcdB family protein [Acerihabitans sp.]|uniref:CcdB family protein n=1 Tax=Acerihabitans sp. TaxID=2811394 RepID=UPI002ED8E1AF
MSQFSVYKNKSVKSNHQYPYIIDVQSDLLSDFQSRVIMPIASRTERNSQVKKLTPEIIINELRYVVITTSIASVDVKKLKEQDLVLQADFIRDAIVSATDTLILGSWRTF